MGEGHRRYLQTGRCRRSEPPGRQRGQVIETAAVSPMEKRRRTSPERILISILTCAEEQ
jgi:hypothetical protein